MLKKCIICDKEFEAKRETAKFCSDKCKLAYHRSKVSVSNDTLNNNDTLNKVSVSNDISNISIKSEQKEYHCKTCGKILDKETYGSIIHLVDKCHECCKDKIPSPKEDQNNFKIIEEKGLHGEKMYFCSKHHEHCKKYCDAMCNENCRHILK